MASFTQEDDGRQSAPLIAWVLSRALKLFFFPLFSVIFEGRTSARFSVIPLLSCHRRTSGQTLE